jgi:ATP-dependent Clp protease ATP-binding subunit ClpA
MVRLRSVGFDLEVSREAWEFLIREGFHPQLGARPLRQTIERNLQDAVAQGLFSYGFGSGRIVVDSTARHLRVAPS